MKARYMLGETRGKINHLLYMVDLKLYGKAIQECDSLVQAVRIFSNDIGIQLRIFNWTMLEIKRGKIVESEGIELPSGETIKSLEDKKGYKYQGVLQLDSVLSNEMKDMITKEYNRRIRKTLRGSLNAGNTIQSINARAVLIIR